MQGCVVAWAICTVYRRAGMHHTGPARVDCLTASASSGLNPHSMLAAGEETQQNGMAIYM